MKYNALLLFILLIACGCSYNSHRRSTEGETHWLKSCEEGSVCGENGTCICGICTTACREDSDCKGHDEDAICTNSIETALAKGCTDDDIALSTSLCVLPCEQDVDCSVDHIELICASDLCLDTDHKLVASETEGEPPLPVVSLGDCENGSDLMSVITSSDQHGADLSFRAISLCTSRILALEGKEPATPQIVYPDDFYDDSVWSVTHQNQYVPPGKPSRMYLNCGSPNRDICIFPCYASFCSESWCQLSEVFISGLPEDEENLWGEHYEIPEEFWPIRALEYGIVDENGQLRLHVIGRGAAYLDGGSWTTVIQPDETTELRGMIEGLMFGDSGARYRNSDGIWTPDPHPAGVTILDAARGPGDKEVYATKDGLFIGESEIPSVLGSISFVASDDVRIGWTTADGEIHVGYWNEDRIEVCRAGIVSEPVLQFDLSVCQRDTIQFQLLTASALRGNIYCGSRPEQ